MSLLIHLPCTLFIFHSASSSSAGRLSSTFRGPSSSAGSLSSTFRASSSSSSPPFCGRQKKDKSVARNKKQSSRTKREADAMMGFNGSRKSEKWTCIQSCGACCKLDKGPAFGTPEEIFDDPADVQLFKSMVGSDGWCIHYDKSTRRCSIYQERPYFCRVEEQVFQNLYGIDKKNFNSEACLDTIKEIYGSDSSEIDNFNLAVKTSTVS